MGEWYSSPRCRRAAQRSPRRMEKALANARDWGQCDQSHNPWQICMTWDELGILVLNEMYDEWVFPKRKWLEGWNVGLPIPGFIRYIHEWARLTCRPCAARSQYISVFARASATRQITPTTLFHPVLGGEGRFTQASYGGYNPDAPDDGVRDIAKRLVKVLRIRHVP